MIEALIVSNKEVQLVEGSGLSSCRRSLGAARLVGSQGAGTPLLVLPWSREGLRIAAVLVTLKGDARPVPTPSALPPCAGTPRVIYGSSPADFPGDF